MIIIFVDCILDAAVDDGYDSDSYANNSGSGYSKKKTYKKPASKKAKVVKLAYQNDTAYEDENTDDSYADNTEYAPKKTNHKKAKATKPIKYAKPSYQNNNYSEDSEDSYGN